MTVITDTEYIQRLSEQNNRLILEKEALEAQNAALRKALYEIETVTEVEGSCAVIENKTHAILRKVGIVE